MTNTVHKISDESDADAAYIKGEIAAAVPRASERERFYATAHYQRVVEGDNDKAISTYKLWRQTYPRDYIPATNLGNIYLNTGRLKEATEQLEDSIALFPSPIAFGNLTGTYAALGERDKMVATYKTWLEKVPSDGSPHAGMSSYFSSIGDYDQSPFEEGCSRLIVVATKAKG